MMSFYMRHLADCHHELFCVNKNRKKVVEELQKYKDILAREQKEFKEEMKREVSASLPSQLSKEKQNLKCV